MGIDAEMLVRRVPRIAVTDEWLKETSWKLCKAIGAEHFFVEAGPTPRLAIDRTLTRYRDADTPAMGSVYQQDGDDVPAENGECLLELSLSGRYYGPGYERGDILAYCAIAEWLEANIEGCEVWYGGDSSGVCAEPFPEAKRRELKLHLFGKNGRDYFGHFENSGLFSDGCKRPEPCSLCPRGQYRGIRNGFGRNGAYGVFHCAGCGKSVMTEDGGATFKSHKDD